MRGVPEIYATMTVPAPDVSVAAAEAIARQHWGVIARASPQTGERDRNFRMHAADGAEYILKFANTAEDPTFRDMQIKALQHIARADPGLAVPRVVPMADGAVQVAVPGESGETLHVRLLTWVPGVPVHGSRRSAAQRVAFGRATARLQLALADFHHPAEAHEMAWDVQHSPGLRDLTFAIPQPDVREAAHAVFDQYAARVAPIADHLRRQVLHNDLNGNNLLLQAANHDEVAGIIDFGDMAETAVAIDIAVAAVTQPGPDMSRADAIFHFLTGYHEARPVPPEEAALLPLLMATRNALSLTLASWHRHTQPGNPHYDVSDTVMAQRLASIRAMQAPEMADAVNRACGTA